MAWLCPELPRGNPLYHQWAHCQPEHPSNMVPLSSLPTATTHPEFILFDIDSLSRLFILSIKKIKQTFLALFSLTITSLPHPSSLPPNPSSVLSPHLGVQTRRQRDWREATSMEMDVSWLHNLTVRTARTVTPHCANCSHCANCANCSHSANS